MLSEKYLNHWFAPYRLSNLNHILQKLWYRVVDLNDRYHYKLTPILDVISENIDFTYFLISCFLNKLPTEDNVRSGFKREVEMKNLDDLIRNLDTSNENQTMAFNNLKIEEIYKQKIVKVSNFTLNRYSKLIFDFRSTITLYYDIFLPFHDKNYVGDLDDCTHIRELPSFFIL